MGMASGAPAGDSSGSPSSSSSDTETLTLLEAREGGGRVAAAAHPNRAGGVLGWWRRLNGLFERDFLGCIGLVYFLQGSRVGFTHLATDYYYKDPVDGLGLSPAESTALIGISGLPWSVKPLYGVLCDAVPIFGTHRKGYLGLMGLIGTAGYGLLAAIPPHRFWCTAALFFCSLGSAFCDVSNCKSASNTLFSGRFFPTVSPAMSQGFCPRISVSNSVIWPFNSRWLRSNADSGPPPSPSSSSLLT